MARKIHTVDCFVEQTVHHETKCDASEYKANDSEHIEHSGNSTPECESADDDGQECHGEREDESRKQPSEPEKLWAKPHNKHQLFDFDLDHVIRNEGGIAKPEIGTNLFF